MGSVVRFDFDRVDAAREAYRSLPAVTVFGEHNDPLGFQAEWAEQIEIPNGNHFPMCDAPSVVAEAVRARFGERSSTETRHELE